MTTSRTKKKIGTVAFIGAGPGDPGLLTLRAADILSTADVVVVERRLRDQAAAHTRPDVEVVDPTRLEPAERIRAMVTPAKEGRRVVRVLDGDAAMFAGLAEEAEGVAKARVPVEFVPGVASVTAVPAYAGIPVTDKKSHAVHVVDVGPDAPEPDWAALASSPGTLVLVRCAKSIGKVAASLLEHGRRGDTTVCC